MIKNYNSVIRALILVLTATIGLSGCSSLSISSIEATDDSYESVNRKVHGFNKALDKNFIRPVSTGYTSVVPTEFQVLVSNFSNNLSLPASVVNKLLQGDIPDAASNAASQMILKDQTDQQAPACYSLQTVPHYWQHREYHPARVCSQRWREATNCLRNYLPKPEIQLARRLYIQCSRVG